MDEIARLAKVSKPTVSRAFKDSPLVKSETKDRILAIARLHGYAVNSNSQKLRTNRTRTVAVVMHLPQQSSEHATAPFYFQLLNDVARSLWERRYDLLLCSPEPDDAYSYETIISSKRADGIIFLGHGPHDKWLTDLARTCVPFVVWGAADLPIAQYFQFPLTTIRQDSHLASSLLVEKLFQYFDGGKPISSTVPTELVIRQT